MNTFLHYLLPLGIVLIFSLAGIIFQRWILVHLIKLASKTKFTLDNILFSSLRGIVIGWFFLAGVYVALIIAKFPLKFSKFVEKILLALFLFSFFWFLANFFAKIIEAYGDKIRSVLPGATIFKNLIKGLILVLGALVILHTLGISITPLITTLGIGGLAVALALQDTLANLFAGLHILASKKIKPGDYIKLESGEEGYVTDITWRDTTIRQLPNNIVIIPNSKLASAIITNYNLPQKEMSVLVQVGVSYDSDLEKVEKVTIEVAKEVMREVNGGVPEFEPFIRYHTFDDFSINFTVILRAKEFVDQYLVKHEFVKRLKKRYDEEGIEIPFPIRTVFLEQKN
ncbi:MAG: mechanosensitive ion channel family protein [Candidatus Desulfofervidus auxilii]|nr:mechanosensitive ion channel family protein [Candidatus Desulfofervidus auxilii]